MLFLTFSIFIWWKYNPDEYDELEKNSMKRPIFAVATLSTCPHCKGFPTLMRQFSDMLGDKSKIIFTALLCEHNKLCDKIGVRGVPAFYLIRGSDPKYWIQTSERTMEGWARFLADSTKSKFVEYTNESNLNELINKTYDGGSTFLFEYDSREYFESYKKTAKFYSLMNCVFIYRSSTDHKNTITAWHAPGYKTTENIEKVEDIKNFIDYHKFSAFHCYDSGEIKDMIKAKRSLALTLTLEPVTDIHLNRMYEITKKHYGTFHTGWIDLYGDQRALGFVGVNNNSGDYFTIIHPPKKCFKIVNETVIMNNPSPLDFLKQFVEDADNGKQCRRIPFIARTNRIWDIRKYIVIGIAALLSIAFIIYFIIMLIQDSPVKIE